jgi:integrase
MSEHTFDNLFAEYIERQSKPHKRTWAEDVQRYEKYLKKSLGNKPLQAIDRKIIMRIHGRLTHAGHPALANRVLALVSSVYDWAINARIYDANPAREIKRNKENSRDRLLQPDELPRFLSALAQETNCTMKDFFLVSLLTGVRRSQVVSMRWADIHFERAEWHVAQAESGKSEIIVLMPEVLQILKGRMQEQDAVFVFPGKGKSGHLMDPKAAWKRLVKRANLDNLTLDDLRKTWVRGEIKSGRRIA